MQNFKENHSNSLFHFSENGAATGFLLTNDDGLGRGFFADTDFSGRFCFVSSLLESGLSSHLGFLLLLDGLGRSSGFSRLGNIDVLLLELKSLGLGLMVRDALLLGHHPSELGTTISGDLLQLGAGRWRVTVDLEGDATVLELLGDVFGDLANLVLELIVPSGI